MSRWVGPAIVALLSGGAAVYFLLAAGGWSIVLEDDFSDPESGWLVESDDRHRYAYVGGEYEILIQAPERDFYSGSELEEEEAALRIEADARLVRGSEGGDYYGVSCGAGDKAGYVFLVWADGYYGVALDPADTEKLVILDEGSTPAGTIHGLGQANRIRAECASDEGKPTRLALTVNGRQLAELADSRRLGPFDWAWLVASSSKKPLPSVTRFDDVVVSAR